MAIMNETEPLSLGNPVKGFRDVSISLIYILSFVYGKRRGGLIREEIRNYWRRGKSTPGEPQSNHSTQR